MTTPSHLQNLWMENETDAAESAAEAATAPENIAKNPVDVAMKRLVRRVRAILKYAQGHCQDKHVKQLLEPLETYAASKTSDMSTTIEDATLDVVEEQAARGNLLPAVKELEAALHQSRPTPVVRRSPKTVTDLLEDVRKLQQLA